MAGVAGVSLVIIIVLFGIISSGSGEEPVVLSDASSAQTSSPTYTPFPTQTDLPTYTPFPTETHGPTYTPFPTQTPFPTPAPTYTPFPTQTPFPTPAPAPTATPVPAYTPTPVPPPVVIGCQGETIRFTIGNLWANESITWETGGAEELNLTLSPDLARTIDVPSRPTSFPIQKTPPYVVVGTVNAPDGTVITAWHGETELISTSVSGGQYSLMIDGGCIGRVGHTAVPPSLDPIATPRPTPKPTATPVPTASSFLTFSDFAMYYERWTQDNFSNGCEISTCFRPGQVGNVLDGWSSVMGLTMHNPSDSRFKPYTTGSKLSFWIRFEDGQGNLVLREGSKETALSTTQGNWEFREYEIKGIRPNYFEFEFTTWSNSKIIPAVFLRDMKIN